LHLIAVSDLLAIGGLLNYQLFKQERERERERERKEQLHAAIL
jgi:hypothetical protein